MASYTKYKNLEKPLSTEKYNIGVANKNNDVIDSELHKLDLKNESQDTLLATKESLLQHTDNTENPHNVTKSQVGLGNVDNTADMNKPVSAAQREAINNACTEMNSYTDIKIANLIDGAPETLDTLKKLADSLNEKYAELDREVLKTIEDVRANTNENKLVSAMVIGELINGLNGCSLEQDGEDFYIVGADSVRKKLCNTNGSTEILGKTYNGAPSDNYSITIPFSVEGTVLFAGITNVNFGVYSYQTNYNHYNVRVSTACSWNGNTISITIAGGNRIEGSKGISLNIGYIII